MEPQQPFERVIYTNPHQPYNQENTEHSQPTLPQPEVPAYTPPQPSFMPPVMPAEPVPSFAPLPPIPPVAPAEPVPPVAPNSVVPQPVVQVLSPIGVEYVFMTISLFVAAGGLAAVLLCLVNGATGYSALAFPVALLVVALPIFAGLFLHLKSAEQKNRNLSLDASKRRSTQTTQIICFLISLFSLIGLVSSIFAKVGGELGSSIVKVFLDVIVLLVVFGGILAYYWIDEHKAR